jgi:hypothetical protein
MTTIQFLDYLHDRPATTALATQLGEVLAVRRSTRPATRTVEDCRRVS